MSVAAACAGLLVLVAARPWRAGAPTRPRSGRFVRPSVAPDPTLTRWVVGAVVAALGLVVGGVPLAVAGGLGWVGSRPLLGRLRHRRRSAAIEAAVPDLVDLFLVAASAGQPVAGSLAVVGPRAPAALGDAVTAADDRFRRGLPLADALDELGGDLGSSAVPLIDALRQAASAGVPLVPLLEGVAASARDARRRRAQEAARRLPVTMLFPLVACILPAAVLLAVVPVLLVSISSLSP